MIMFADAGAMVPYYRNEVTEAAGTIPAGLRTEAVFNTEIGDPFTLQNYGIAAGFLGNIFIADYRLEYRNYKGTFKPAFYGSNYDRIRGDYATTLKDDLLSPQEIEPIMGIYLESGFTIGDKFRFEAGYMWPWDSDFEFGEDDYLHLEAELFSGVIPVVDIHGSISYDRTKFVPALIASDDPSISLFDANTIVSGELIYPVAPMLDLAILVTTTVTHDADGNVVADEYGNPKVSPSISIETRIHF